VDGQGRPLARLSPQEARALLGEGVIGGGMIPKVEAALTAAGSGVQTFIIDGRRPRALLEAVQGGALGTCIG